MTMTPDSADVRSGDVLGVHAARIDEPPVDYEKAWQRLYDDQAGLLYRTIEKIGLDVRQGSWASASQNGMRLLDLIGLLSGMTQIRDAFTDHSRYSPLP